MPEIVNHLGKNILSYVIIALLGFFGKTLIEIKTSLPVVQRNIEINASVIQGLIDNQTLNNDYKMRVNSRLDRLETTVLNMNFNRYE